MCTKAHPHLGRSVQLVYQSHSPQKSDWHLPRYTVANKPCGMSVLVRGSPVPHLKISTVEDLGFANRVRGNRVVINLTTEELFGLEVLG